MKNQRVNYCGTVITLRPGQQLHHETSEATDEGYSYEAFELEYDVDEGVVFLDSFSGGVDCDGPISRHCRLFWNGEDWTPVAYDQRDLYAEAMGY